MDSHAHKATELQAHYANLLATMPEDIRYIITRQLPYDAATKMLMALNLARESAGATSIDGRSEDYHLGVAHSQIQAAITYKAISEAQAARLHDYLKPFEGHPIGPFGLH